MTNDTNHIEESNPFEYSVLLAADSLLNLHTLSEILGSEYNIFTANNGFTAVEIAQEKLPDIIILDIVMPGMDGYAVITALKSNEKTQEIPIIIITGLIGAEEEEKGLTLGAVDYIAKPFNPAIIRLRVRNQIKILHQIKMMKQSSIVENSPHVIFYLTSDGSVSYLNPAGIRMTGYSEAEIIESGLELIFDEQTVDDIKNIHIPNTMENGSAACEINMVPKDRELRILSFTCFMTDTNDIGVIAQDITQVRELELEVVKVYYDALTGIYNRRYFDENFERLLRSMSRSDSVLCLMMIDIDNFKNFNDTYGHKEGDHCLKIVAEALTGSISRTEDFIARYGGEEFVAVLPYTDLSGAKVVAQRLLDSVRNQKIPHENTPVAEYVTVSIGVAVGRIAHPISSETHIMRADEMLYKSKQEGKDRISYFQIE